MYCIAPIPQAKAAGRAGRALGFRGVLYKAQQRGVAPAQQGAARWGAAWRARQGSGKPTCWQQCWQQCWQKERCGPVARWALVAIVFARDVLVHRML